MRRLATVAAALVLAGVLAGDASAAISLVFSKLHARPGERMSAYQPGGLAWRPGEHAGVTVYLIPTSLLPSFGAAGIRHGRPRTGPRVRLLGELVGDAHGVGRVVFRVPRVRPGRYTTAVFCRPCGNTYFASRFRDNPDRYSRHPDPGILRVRR
jgi:hypothetical protein